MQRRLLGCLSHFLPMTRRGMITCLISTKVKPLRGSADSHFDAFCFAFGICSALKAIASRRVRRWERWARVSVRVLCCSLGLWPVECGVKHSISEAQWSIASVLSWLSSIRSSKDRCLQMSQANLFWLSWREKMKDTWLALEPTSCLVFLALPSWLNFQRFKTTSPPILFDNRELSLIVHQA